jgi:hypothetical protein
MDGCSGKKHKLHIDAINLTQRGTKKETQHSASPRTGTILISVGTVCNEDDTKRMHRKKDKQTRMILHKCTAPNECKERKKKCK